MNPRRHPRTLNEAFPRTAEYACAIDRPARYGLRTWLRIIVAIVCCAEITMLLAMSFPTKS